MANNYYSGENTYDPPGYFDQQDKSESILSGPGLLACGVTRDSSGASKTRKLTPEEDARLRREVIPRIYKFNKELGEELFEKLNAGDILIENDFPEGTFAETSLGKKIYIRSFDDKYKNLSYPPPPEKVDYIDNVEKAGYLTQEGMHARNKINLSSLLNYAKLTVGNNLLDNPSKKNPLKDFITKMRNSAANIIEKPAQKEQYLYLMSELNNLSPGDPLRGEIIELLKNLYREAKQVGVDLPEPLK